MAAARFFLPKTLRSCRSPRTTSRPSESHAGIWGGDAAAIAKRPPLLAFKTSRVVPAAAPPPACVGLAAARDGEQSNPVGPHHNVPESLCRPEQYAVTGEVLMLGGSDLDLPDSGHDGALVNHHAAVVGHCRVNDDGQRARHWRDVGNSCAKQTLVGVGTADLELAQFAPTRGSTRMCDGIARLS